MTAPFFLKNHRGFTLVELMVAITILVIISAIGIASYSQAQKVARDAKRKADLYHISVALELYYQANGHYPINCPDCVEPDLFTATTSHWQTSTPPHPQTCLDSSWISGSDPKSASPNNSCALPLAPNYTDQLPFDPINSAFNYWYLYKSTKWTGCPPQGQWYALTTKLENPNDRDDMQNKNVLWCDGSDVSAGFGFGPSSYLIVVKR